MNGRGKEAYMVRIRAHDNLPCFNLSIRKLSQYVFSSARKVLLKKKYCALTVYSSMVHTIESGGVQKEIKS